MTHSRPKSSSNPQDLFSWIDEKTDRTEIEEYHSYGIQPTLDLDRPVENFQWTVGPTSHGAGFSGRVTVEVWNHEWYIAPFLLKRSFNVRTLGVPMEAQSGSGPAGGQTCTWTMMTVDPDTKVPTDLVYTFAPVTFPNSPLVRFVNVNFILEPGHYCMIPGTNSGGAYSNNFTMNMPSRGIDGTSIITGYPLSKLSLYAEVENPYAGGGPVPPLAQSPAIDHTDSYPAYGLAGYWV